MRSSWLPECSLLLALVLGELELAGSVSGMSRWLAESGVSQAMAA